MCNRLAAILALIAFATCLLIGMSAGNPFSTTVLRALAALCGTFVVGLLVGAMAQKMLDENLKISEQKFQNNEAKSEGTDR